MSSIPTTTTYRKNAEGQSVFDETPDYTHDADGLTPEERDSLPFPYNRYVPRLWPVDRNGTPTPIELLPQRVHALREINLIKDELAKQKYDEKSAAQNDE